MEKILESKAVVEWAEKKLKRFQEIPLTRVYDPVAHNIKHLQLIDNLRKAELIFDKLCENYLKNETPPQGH